jgi:hypothetical protein
LLQRSDVLRGIFRYFGDVYLWAKPRYWSLTPMQTRSSVRAPEVSHPAST